MKRTLSIIVIILLLAVTCVYILIPGQIRISHGQQVNVPEGVLTRTLIYKSGWIKWLGAEKEADSSDSVYRFIRKNRIYKFSENTITDIKTIVSEGNLSASGRLGYIVKDSHKAIVEWAVVIRASKNPLARIQQYLFARDIKQDMVGMLSELNMLYNDPAKVYGSPIRITRVKDSVLIATKKTVRGFPTTVFIEKTINELRIQATSEQAVKTDSPMLNITKISPVAYEMMVALPINKIIPVKNGAYIKRMVLGNLLETTVQGGPGAIHRALNQMSMFKDDYRLVSPAIPFESMLTNRVAEPDTTKWLTKIYYPIF